jgi:phospholipid/cholesterol/gamma-HCH transport system permease protein
MRADIMDLFLTHPGQNFKRWVFEIQNCTILGVKSIWNLFRPPIYLRETFEMMDIIGVGSLSITLLTAFFTGAVLALQTSKTLISFGAMAYTGQLVALALVRELGPVLTAVVVAGRIGSGIASELGSMLISEQINAMRALGTDPIKKLVTPRMLAAVTMVPVLTIICDFIGVMGGFFVSYFLLGQSPALYLTSSYDQLTYADLVQGLLKPPIFGFIIAIVGCYCGLRTYGGTQGVGRSTTQSVVSSMILIFLTDFFITRLLLSVL